MTSRPTSPLPDSTPSLLQRSDALFIITAPFIWSCLAPALFMDLVLTIYQHVCFRVYGIPLIRRGDHIVFDRHRLRYLSGLEKLNCLYCSYFNGVASYAREVGARTEQYWCPIKHAARKRQEHSRYEKFFPYGDADSYRQGLAGMREDFDDLRQEAAAGGEHGKH